MNSIGNQKPMPMSSIEDIISVRNGTTDRRRRISCCAPSPTVMTTQVPINSCPASPPAVMRLRGPLLTVIVPLRPLSRRSSTFHYQKSCPFARCHEGHLVSVSSQQLSDLFAQLTALGVETNDCIK